MDSLTQIVLAAALTAAIAPANNRRAALLAGAALGTLPDLDVFPLLWLTDDPVLHMTLHRGLSHSLFMLPLFGLLIWWACRQWGQRVKAAPARWFWAIQAALVTHPLLDALTVYGTQLLWPLTLPPVMWSTLFIIDPLYTIWLLLGCVVALIAGQRKIAQQALLAGLALSTAYIGWSFAAKAMVDKAAQAALAQMGYADAPYFSVPLPFNTVLWRTVALTPDGFLQADRSLIADKGPMHFRHYPSDNEALQATAALPSVRQLLWFSNGFMKAQVLTSPDHSREWLVLSDLRMGVEPEFFFNFALAERPLQGSNDQWQPLHPPQRLPRSSDSGRGWSLKQLTERIFNEPPPPQ